MRRHVCVVADGLVSLGASQVPEAARWARTCRRVVWPRELRVLVGEPVLRRSGFGDVSGKQQRRVSQCPRPRNCAKCLESLLVVRRDVVPLEALPALRVFGGVLQDARQRVPQRRTPSVEWHDVLGDVCLERVDADDGRAGCGLELLSDERPDESYFLPVPSISHGSLFCETQQTMNVSQNTPHPLQCGTCANLKAPWTWWMRCGACCWRWVSASPMTWMPGWRRCWGR